jgi:2,4-dienoyl-CoA reductase-like NADH-dependent reductase (Old Yellow Enzyme family)
MDDTVVLAGELKARGVDVVDCSSGGITGPSKMPLLPRVPGYHVEFSECVRTEVQIPTVAVGLITEARQAEDILQQNQADIIALARELLYNPNWPLHAAHELGVDDYLDLLPYEYAFRLQRRLEVSQMEINKKR